MMPTGDVETYHKDGEWHNRIEGENEDLGAHPTKEEAVKAGRTARSSTSSAASTARSVSATPTVMTRATFRAEVPYGLAIEQRTDAAG
jgi:Uncharacterized protein conserved in bacteria (DUF2188)